jgi:hypothetical protein
MGGWAPMAETFGQVAGLAGLSLFVMYMLFRDVIKRLLIESIGPERTFKTLRMLLLLVGAVTVVGITVWGYEGDVIESAGPVIKWVWGSVYVDM